MNRKGLLDEFLSTHEEIHAFVHGIYAGLTEWKGIDSETMKNPDVIAEIAYTKGGYVLGTLIRVAIILLVGKTVLGS
jgi:hypothetical protein